MVRPRQQHHKALGEKVFQPPAERVFQVEQEAWRDEALCAQIDPEQWFPEKSMSRTAQVARKVCQTCPVQLACLTEALKSDEKFGVWGGVSERTRRDLHQAVKRGATPGDVATAYLHGQEALRRWAG